MEKTRAESDSGSGKGQDDSARLLRVTGRIAVPLRELEWSATTSSGPGGQNVNRVRTKVTLRWPLAHSRALPEGVQERLRERFARRITGTGELVIASQRYRSQQRNADDCLEKLRELLLEVARPPIPRKATRPTRGSVERRLAQKSRRSQAKKQRRRPDE
jgi:ribosome-associated protein